RKVSLGSSVCACVLATTNKTPASRIELSRVMLGRTPRITERTPLAMLRRSTTALVAAKSVPKRLAFDDWQLGGPSQAPSCSLGGSAAPPGDANKRGSAA